MSKYNFPPYRGTCQNCRATLRWELMMRAIFRTFLALLMFAALGVSAEAAQTLKINESLGPGSPEAAALAAFKARVERGSGGQLKVDIFLLDALGGPQTSLENLMTGSLDLYSGALEYYTPLAPKALTPVSLPYFLPDFTHLKQYLASPVFQAARQALLARGIRFLELSAERGPYRVLVSTRPVLGVKDLEGLKLRVFPDQVYIRAWKHLGAVPLEVAWTQTYLGLRQGLLQAVTAPLTTIRPMKFTEVARYVIAIKEYPQVWPIAISEKVWQHLGPAQQKLLEGAAQYAAKVYTKVTEEHAAEDITYMIKTDNAVFIELNTAPFRQKLLPFYQELLKQGLLSKNIYETVSRIVAK